VAADAAHGGLYVDDDPSPPTITSTGAVETTGGDAIYGDTSAFWIVVNSGKIETTGTTGDGIDFLAGGSVTNAVGGLIEGGSNGVFITGAAGTVTNSGTILGRYAVQLYEGGSVTNAGTGLIQGFAGVVLQFGGASVVNSSMISGTGIAGVYLNSDGYVGNTAGLIEGYADGVFAHYGAGTVTNTGIISGTASFAIGVGFHSGSSTLVNAGTITGSSGTAVNLGDTGSNLLVLEHGYNLSGAYGTAGSTNTVELLGTAGAVTADYNGLSLTNFGTIAFGAASRNIEIWKITNDASLPGRIFGTPTAPPAPTSRRPVSAAAPRSSPIAARWRSRNWRSATKW